VSQQQQRPQSQQPRPPMMRIAEDELTLLRELADRNQQEQKLTRISADRDVQIERSKHEAITAKYDARQSRHITVGVVAALLIVAGLIFGAIYWTHTYDGQKQREIARLHEQTIQECIQAKNIWVNDACLIAGKS
jgi:type VI protein secretion system component VasF